METSLTELVKSLMDSFASYALEAIILGLPFLIIVQSEDRKVFNKKIVQSKAFFVTNHLQPIIAICILEAFEISNFRLEKLGSTILLSFAKILNTCFFILKSFLRGKNSKTFMDAILNN